MARHSHGGRPAQAAHTEELMRLTGWLGSTLATEAPDIALDVRHAVAETMSTALLAAHAMGRRHALCELIANTAGPGHPNNEDAYVLSVTIATPEQRAEAQEAIRRIVDYRAEPEPPTGDLRN